MAGADPALAQHMAEVPGALPALVGALAAGSAKDASDLQQATATNRALVLANMASATPGLAQCVAGAQGTLPAQVTAMGAGGNTATDCAHALRVMASAYLGLAQRVAEAPGALPALPALVTAVAAGGAQAASASQQAVATNSALALANIASANPGLAQRVAEAEGALPALVTAMAAGGDTATNCAQALRAVAEASPALTQCVAKVPRALLALVAAVAAGGNTAEAAGAALTVERTWAHAGVAASGTACVHCGRSADRATGVCLRLCAGCNTARVCNSECQRHAWTGHKAACRAFALTSDGNAGA